MTTTTLDRPVDVDRSACTGTRHGTPAAYSRSGCRCPDARAADTARRSEQRRARVAAGWRRARGGPRRPRPPRPAQPQITNPAEQVWASSARDRLRVLVAVGYDWDTLAGMLLPGWSAEALTADRSHIIPRRVTEQVRDVFADLIRYPSPCGTAAERALDYATVAGWGVVDMVAVRRALAESEHRDPDTRCVVRLTALERRAVIYVGAALGYSDTAISWAASASGQTVTEALDKGKT